MLYASADPFETAWGMMLEENSVAIPQTATSVNGHTDKPKQRHGNKARRFSEVEHKSDTSAISEEGMCAHSKDGNWAQVDDASQPIGENEPSKRFICFLFSMRSCFQAFIVSSQI